MAIPRCEICNKPMVKNGKTKAGKQRWFCKECGVSLVRKINTDAKQLESFLRWLMSKDRQIDMPSQGRSFRNHTSKFWSYWALPSLVDEIHRVVYVDGIHLSRNVVVLIACSDEYVLGWYLARHENSKAWANLLRRIAPPDIVISDGGQGFQKALKRIWPQTSLQRCIFHAYCQVKRYTTLKPRLLPGAELLGIARDLLYIKEENEAAIWLKNYSEWTERWNDFLSEKSYIDGKYVFTHMRLRKARSSLNRLINSNNLFTYLDPLLTIGGKLPATNNRIEGGVNAPLRQMLREHRGMSLTRRIKAVFWWCYLHTECPLKPADILKVMPTDNDIDKIYNKLTNAEKLASDIPKWGDAIVWSDLHHIDYSHDSFRHDWD